MYADENIEKKLVEELRRVNMDVLWVAEKDSLRKQKDDTFHYKKAKHLNRYLLTKDRAFWGDRKYPLHESPGVIIINIQNKELGVLLVRLLRKLLIDYNPLNEPLYLQGSKIKLSDSEIKIHMLNHDTQKKETSIWNWKELY